MSDTDPRITKRKVTMRTYSARPGPDGQPAIEVREAVDYVRPDILDAYLAEARSDGRWQEVEVSDEPDAGPGGYDGETHIPAHLDHPLAGQTFAATATKED